ncbi:hypothetical protein FRACYDRAFT_240664 [Fragilariopsis cylindrus CCMP1102]|uniref:Uncharacterized protein n=1 Tax=Fragilariopsis cylindrus CCMP1102 TaxID=635003 RepID=A0A1E7FCT3_9STRA|nr:hypothetical protein FRACYDRAFT_240664 [Fragilariopsis cylindrus CCMP1102]|eukprot:OEU15967.1 hypothetical protein FRACYDRAFT_240664 [Fragilariopsis cylindrus CCMP1102]
MSTASTTTSTNRFDQISIQVSKMSRHPAKLINETSWLIVNGEYDDAIVSLTHTLKTLKLVLSGDAKILIPLDEMNNEEDEDNDDNASCFLKTAIAVNGRHSIGNNNRCYTNSTTVNPHDTQDQEQEQEQQQQQQQHKLQVSIFRDPILVRGDHFHSPLDVEVCEQLSYVAIYNLALSHHLKSVQLSQEQEEEEEEEQRQLQLYTTASSSFSASRKKRANENIRRIYLQKALSLYEHSHQILMKQTINVGVPVIHSMALVSNLGQIHHSLGDHHKAGMCMQYLLSTMMYVIDCGKVNTLGKSMDGFFNMILPLIAKDDPAAAA